MQIPRPHFLTSERMAAPVEWIQPGLGEAPILPEPVYGYHTLWIAEVPFIVNEGPRDFAYESEKRLGYVLQRQERFLYDLAQSSKYLSTFELRFVSWPQPQGPTQVGIAFLGKVFHADRLISIKLATDLWDKFSAVFPRESPFSYPLVPVRENVEPTSQQTHSFDQWYQPVPFEQLSSLESIVELRKYEDWPMIRGLGGVLRARDYIAQPFEPALDYSALGRLFETLARQREISIVSITLRPQRLTNREILFLHEVLDWYQRILKGEVQIEHLQLELLQDMECDPFTSYLKMRAALGVKVYENLLREQNNLFLGRLQVIGFLAAQHDLIETLGSEMTAAVDSEYPGRWVRVEIKNAQELRKARLNVQWLEFSRWGTSEVPQQNLASFISLRQVMTVAEAMGAFRLPIASSGGLAGIEVRDEPFGLPTSQKEISSEKFALGTLQDRGLQTRLSLLVPGSIFGGISLLSGVRSEAQDRILQTLLQEAGTAHIPWVLLRNRETLTDDPLPLLATRTFSVQSHRGPYPFQPLLPPPNLPISRFLDGLLGIFTAAYQLDLAVAILLRTILTEVYERTDWPEQLRTTPCGIDALATPLETVLTRLPIPESSIHAIRTRILLPLQDLALTAGPLFISSPETSSLWKESTIITLGWLGSDQNQALLRGCLWNWFALAFLAQKKSQEHIGGLVALEDGSLLFGPPADTNRSMVNLAYTLARSNIGTLLIEEETNLLSEQLTNETIIVTQSANERTLEKIVRTTGISARHAARMRLLRAREAIIVRPGIAPAIIHVESKEG